MLTEIVCAVAVLMTLRHVLELLEQNAELAQQVLYLSFRVRRLRELSKKLMVSSDAWRMLGRRRPSARMLGTWSRSRWAPGNSFRLRRQLSSFGVRILASGQVRCLPLQL